MNYRKTLVVVAILGPLFSFYATTSAAVIESFIPLAGESNINFDGASRYSLQYVYWKPQNLTEYDAWNDTFELETIFYNYDGTAYGTDIATWNTNLPNPYKDTEYLDNANEPNLAIGTFDPTALVADTWYGTHVSLNTTVSDASFYKISGQLGYSVCEFSAYCVNNASGGILIPFKIPFKAPESFRSYRYEWESNNYSYVADRLALGKWGSGVISASPDVDWYVFNVPTARTVNMVLNLGNSTVSIDYDVEIYTPSGAYIVGSYQGTGLDEEFSRYLVAGDYLVRVYSYSGANPDATYNFIAY